MGDRYIVQVKCPDCGFIDSDVYFAPTCGFFDWECPKCSHIIDLHKLTGITYEEASNVEIINDLIKECREREGR